MGDLEDPKDAKLGKVGRSGRTLLAEQAIEDTSSPGDFVAVDAKLLKDYDDSMRQRLERQSIPRVDWMGNVLPPMLIEPFGHRVNRLGRKMSDEDRALRAQWVRDQRLAPDEPRFIPELKPKNYFRRLFNPFWDKAGQAVRNKWGIRVASNFRYFAPKLVMVYLGSLVVWYHMKYHPFSWEESSGWRMFYSRPVIWPGDKDYPIRELNAEDFYDYGFSTRKALKNDS